MVTGTLAEVDDHMNMYLDNAVWTPVEGPPQVMPLGAATAPAPILPCKMITCSCSTYQAERDSHS
jgi:hypothetical protein